MLLKQHYYDVHVELCYASNYIVTIRLLFRRSMGGVLALQCSLDAVSWRST